MSKRNCFRASKSEKKVTFREDVDVVSVTKTEDTSSRDVKCLELCSSENINDRNTEDINNTEPCLCDKFTGETKVVKQTTPPKLTNINKVSITFSLSSIPAELDFNRFNSLLDLWFVNFQDEENIFRRQFEETEYRSRLIMENELKVNKLFLWMREVQKLQEHLEVNLNSLDLHLSELEEFVNTVSTLERECFNPRGYHIYNCIITIDCRIKDIENDLSEMNNYLSNIENSFPCSPLSMIKRLVRTNENAIRKSIGNVQNMESTALCVHNQMNTLETLLNLKNTNRHC